MRSLRRLALDPQAESLSPREQAALDDTRPAPENPHALSEALWNQTNAHFTAGEIVERTLHSGLTGMLNRRNDCLGVRYNNDYDEPAAGEETEQR